MIHDLNDMLAIRGSNNEKKSKAIIDDYKCRIERHSMENEYFRSVGADHYRQNRTYKKVID